MPTNKYKIFYTSERKFALVSLLTPTKKATSNSLDESHDE